MNLTSLFSVPDAAQAAVQSGGGIQVSEGATDSSPDNSPSIFHQLFRSAAHGEHAPAAKPVNGSHTNHVEVKAENRALSEAPGSEKDVSQLLAELIYLFQNLMAQNQVEPSEGRIGYTSFETPDGNGELSPVNLFVNALRAILEKAVQGSGLNGEQDERLYSRLVGIIEGFKEDISGLLQHGTGSGLSAMEPEGFSPENPEILDGHETDFEEGAIPFSPAANINSSLTAWLGDGVQDVVVEEEDGGVFQDPIPAERSYESTDFGFDSDKITSFLSNILVKLQAEYEKPWKRIPYDANTGYLNGGLLAQLQHLYKAVSALSDAATSGPAGISRPASDESLFLTEVNSNNDLPEFQLQENLQARTNDGNDLVDFMIHKNFRASGKNTDEGRGSQGQKDSVLAPTFDQETANPDMISKDPAQLSSLKEPALGVADGVSGNVKVDFTGTEPGVERIILPPGDMDTIEIFYSDSDARLVPEEGRQRGAQRPADNAQISQTVVSLVTPVSEDIVVSQSGDSVGPIKADNDESAGFGGSSAMELSSPNSMDRVASAADSRGMSGNNQNESTSQHGFSLGASIAPTDSDIRPDNESLSRLPYLVKQLEHGLTRAVQMNRNRAVLHLNPPELGSVTVRLSVHGNNEVRAVFLTDNPDTRHLIASGMDSLRNHLASNGFSLTGADVGNNSMHADSGQGGSQGFGDPRHDSSVFNEEVTATEQPVASTSAEESRLLHMIV